MKGFISNYMERALSLAKKGLGYVNPNPLVGAVIVKDDKIIGEGFHKSYGNLHAEREAIKSAEKYAIKIGEDPSSICKDSDLYVTLEPCSHTGKQPPCTDAIIQAGIKHVFIGCGDPNPLVSGKGISLLQKAGVQVTKNVLHNECVKLNPIFFHYIKTKTPYVTLKYAMSADGLTACYTGNSKWVSGTESIVAVHKERAINMAIMTGIKTVLQDDPELTCRTITNARQPIRIVCDSHLQIPLESKLVQTARDVPVIVACALSDSEYEASEKAKQLELHGVEIICVPNTKGKVNLTELMKILGTRAIDSVLIESGGELSYSALSEGIVQRLLIFVAPKIFGNPIANPIGSFTPVRGKGVSFPDDCIKLGKPQISLYGEDVLLEYFLENGGKNCLPE